MQLIRGYRSGLFLGSGTTCAVAHKNSCGTSALNKWSTPHLSFRVWKKSAGEQGVSQTVDWQGGGSFVYCELAKLNQTIVEEIEATSDAATLSDIYGRMVKSGFISYKGKSGRY